MGRPGRWRLRAEALFPELEVDGLEFDDARSGGFAPLRVVPEGKVVVLGLVTTERPQLEGKDDPKRRIDEAARYVPLDQLALSPQCGPSSTAEGNALTQEGPAGQAAPGRRDRRGGVGLTVRHSRRCAGQTSTVAMPSTSVRQSS